MTELACHPLVAELEAKRGRLLAALQALVEAESPSTDADALRTAADVLVMIGAELAGVTLERGEIASTPYVIYDPPGEANVALIGHFDTVWPRGTVAERPFRVDDDWVHGPGVLDMKCGIVQGLGALSAVGADGVMLLFTGDEELGSPTSRALIEATARRVPTVLVLEPAAGEALKIARKGCAVYELAVVGREAHAGLEPENGVNATVALAHAVIAASQLGDDRAGTTVTPTTATAGTAFNTVPGAATFHVDVRAWTADELARVDGQLHAIHPGVPGAELAVRQGPVRPPLAEELARPLLELAQREALALGLGPLETARVGGGSDGSFTAGVGTPTLDGLGAVGAGAHAPDERVSLSAIAPRSALVGALVEAIRKEPR